MCSPSTVLVKAPVSALISAALLMLRLHGPAEPFHLLQSDTTSCCPASTSQHSFLLSFLFTALSFSLPFFTKNSPLKWLRPLCFQSITNPMCLPPPSQPPAHPGLQRCRLHSALELDGGRPGVHLPDLPLGPLPARPVPAGRAAAVGACPCGGGVLRVTQVSTLHKPVKGPVCEMWLCFMSTRYSSLHFQCLYSRSLSPHTRCWRNVHSVLEEGLHQQGAPVFSLVIDRHRGTGATG